LIALEIFLARRVPQPVKSLADIASGKKSMDKEDAGQTPSGSAQQALRVTG